MSDPNRQPPEGSKAHGFTLLEVILALGILAVSLAIVGQVTRLAYRNAERAELEGEALLIAESVMAQVSSGLVDPVDLPVTAWNIGNETPRWQYALTIEPTDLPELLAAQVRVEQISESPNPISVQVVRWVLDPAQIEEVTTTEDL